MLAVALVALLTLTGHGDTDAHADLAQGGGPRRTGSLRGRVDIRRTAVAPEQRRPTVAELGIAGGEACARSAARRRLSRDGADRRL